MPSSSGDEGSAVIEFVLLGVLLLVPLVFVVQAAAALHSAAQATAVAARAAARAFASADGVAQGRARAEAAARLAFADQGLDLPAGGLALACLDGPCLAPGSAVVASVDWQAPLPWLPGWWGDPPSVRLSSEQRSPVDAWRSEPAP